MVITLLLLARPHLVTTLHYIITTTFVTTQVAKGLGLLANDFVKKEDIFLWLMLYKNFEGW